MGGTIFDATSSGLIVEETERFEVILELTHFVPKIF